MSAEETQRLGISDTFLGNAEWTQEQQDAVSALMRERLPQLLTEYRERILFTEVVFNHKTNTVSLIPATLHG